jgi:hypothetical protein
VERVTRSMLGFADATDCTDYTDLKIPSENQCNPCHPWRFWFLMSIPNFHKKD